MAIFKVPLVAAQQRFKITLNSVVYTLQLVWTSYGQFWVMNIGDSNGNPIANGIPLIIGADLLEQYEYLNLGGRLIVQTEYNASVIPTFTDLGDTSNLYFITE